MGTQMSNLGLELALKDRNIELARAKVGDRYVMAELLARGWIYGGESSGHIICLDVTTTGDGIVSALQVLAAMQGKGRSLAETRSGMTKFPQTMVNVRMNKRERLKGNAAIAQAEKAVVDKLRGRGRVLLRPSGTEPVVRVMVEGEDAVFVKTLANELADVVRAEVS